MIPDSKLDELLALAENATPGQRKWVGATPYDSYDGLSVECEPYTVRDSTYTECEIIGAHGEHTQGWVEIGENDAAFIAATDPETIRALVEEVKRHREECGEDEGPPIDAPEWDGKTPIKPGDVYAAPPLAMITPLVPGGVIPPFCDLTMCSVGGGEKCEEAPSHEHRTISIAEQKAACGWVKDPEQWREVFQRWGETGHFETRNLE